MWITLNSRHIKYPDNRLIAQSTKLECDIRTNGIAYILLGVNSLLVQVHDLSYRDAIHIILDYDVVGTQVQISLWYVHIGVVHVMPVHFISKFRLVPIIRLAHS